MSLPFSDSFVVILQTNLKKRRTLTRNSELPGSPDCSDSQLRFFLSSLQVKLPWEVPAHYIKRNSPGNFHLLIRIYIIQLVLRNYYGLWIYNLDEICCHSFCSFFSSNTQYTPHSAKLVCWFDKVWYLMLCWMESTFATYGEDSVEWRRRVVRLWSATCSSLTLVTTPTNLYHAPTNSKCRYT